MNAQEPAARKRRFLVVTGRAGLCLALTVMPTTSSTGADTPERLLRLAAIGATTGPFGKTTQSGEVEIEVVGGRTRLEFMLFGLTPNAVHSVIVDFDLTQPPLVGSAPPANCVATDPETGTRADVYCFTPAAPDDAAFTGGQGLDPHGFISDESGNAIFRQQLNYDIFQPESAPVVLRPGVTQTVPATASGGTCIGARDGTLVAPVGSAYMRVFDPATAASLPTRSPSFAVPQARLKPRLVRATVLSVIIQEHLDGFTRGMVNGVGVITGGVSQPCGDHGRRLQGSLRDALPKS